MMMMLLLPLLSMGLLFPLSAGVVVPESVLPAHHAHMPAVLPLEHLLLLCRNSALVRLPLMQGTHAPARSAGPLGP